MGHRLIIKERKSKTKNTKQSLEVSFCKGRVRISKPSPLVHTNRHKKKEPEKGRSWWWQRSWVTAPSPLSAEGAQGSLHCSQRRFRHWTKSTPHQEPHTTHSHTTSITTSESRHWDRIPPKKAAPSLGILLNTMPQGATASPSVGTWAESLQSLLL